jgi:hypothetical protein
LYQYAMYPLWLNLPIFLEIKETECHGNGSLADTLSIAERRGLCIVESTEILKVEHGVLDRLTTQKSLAQPTHRACSRRPDYNLRAPGTASLEQSMTPLLCSLVWSRQPFSSVKSLPLHNSVSVILRAKLISWEEVVHLNWL